MFELSQQHDIEQSDGGGANFPWTFLRMRTWILGLINHKMMLVATKLGFARYSNYYNDDHFGYENENEEPVISQVFNEVPSQPSHERQVNGVQTKRTKDGQTQSEVGRVRAKYTNSRATLDMIDPQFQVGMKFSNKEEFKKVIDNYSIVHGKPLYLYTNDSSRLRSKCDDPCNWFVFGHQQQQEGDVGQQHQGDVGQQQQQGEDVGQ
ncbi:hypothetical protein ACH5RR_006706 [Cinchona calisaya]|uniref:Transposase MuDR plant domain-containing protein n=1 Tax=Cinchona calisaya TaxID=153742 RepID=A0ABD3APU5_9GENT